MAFEAKFNQGRNFYLNSNWKVPIKLLKEADEMMITGMNESGAMGGDIVHYKLFCKDFFLRFSAQKGTNILPKLSCK